MSGRTYCPRTHMGQPFGQRAGHQLSTQALAHAATHLAALVARQNWLVVKTPGALLVAERSHCQDFKHTLNTFKKQKRE